jgi:phosphatidate cytidylyltransferase
LIPAVSPGKTWEGFIAALVMSIIIALSAALLSHIPSSKWIFIILLSFLTVLFSILGDLFESMLKRQAKLKDSGKLLPGHGGLLDRVDSLMPAAPIFSLMAYGLSQLSS